MRGEHAVEPSARFLFGDRHAVEAALEPSFFVVHGLSMINPSSGAQADPAQSNPDAAQSQFIARMRWMMLISGATTVLAIAAVLGVIGYRLLHQEGSALPDVTALLPKGARIVSTAVAADRIAVTLDVNGSIEVRTYDVKTLRATGTLKFAIGP